jgi:hypothetical protein
MIRHPGVVLPAREPSSVTTTLSCLEIPIGALINDQDSLKHHFHEEIPPVRFGP